MLHALLHGKLDEMTPEPERLEDALTSTVIGTLVLVGASDVLADWFGRAKRVDGSCSPVDHPRINGVWFWPQLALAEPDVILRLGDELFVIEAKYHSDRHDASPGDDGERITDQLHRQWASLGKKWTSGGKCPRDLQASVATCRTTLIFLVDGRRLRRAQRQFRESANRLPQDADLRLLTWQSLHEILTLASQGDATSPWSKALDEYFERAGLQGFTGFRQCVRRLGCASVLLTKWRGLQASRPIGLREVLTVPRKVLSVAGSWRVHRARTTQDSMPAGWQEACTLSVDRYAPARTWTFARGVDSDLKWLLLPEQHHNEALLPARAFTLSNGSKRAGLREAVMPLTSPADLSKVRLLEGFHVVQNGDRQ